MNVVAVVMAFLSACIIIGSPLKVKAGFFVEKWIGKFESLWIFLGDTNAVGQSLNGLVCVVSIGNRKAHGMAIEAQSLWSNQVDNFSRDDQEYNRTCFVPDRCTHDTAFCRCVTWVLVRNRGKIFC